MYDSEADDDFSSLYEDDNHNMGIVLPAIGGAVSAISSIFGGGSKDPGRLKSNAEAYAVAINGNGPYKDKPSGLEFLRVMSSSWATDKAKKDAMAKYNQASAIIAQQQNSRTQPSPSGVPAPGGAGGPLIAGMSSGPLLVAGAAALGIFMLMRNKR